jgi:DNA repair protein RadD
MKLRDYQLEAVTCIWNYFENKTGNPIVAMPTGTGKSLVIAGFCESVYKIYPTTKILAMTHVKELIGQNYSKFIELWPGAPAGIYSAGLKRKDTMQKVIFCGVASVAKKAHLFGHVDIIIVDECDLISPDEETMYRKFFAALMLVNPKLKIVGFTATPWRLGSGHLTEEGGLFTDVCFDITNATSFNRLIAEGYLCPVIPKKTKLLLDTDGIKMRGGEFIESELQVAVDKEEITKAALMEAYQLKDERKHWLIFASGIIHAQHICDMLNDMGVACTIVHSKLSPVERDKNILDFREGRVQAIVNNNVLTTGFDSPWVDLILGLRPTASSRLWVQIIGRGTRPYIDPDTFVKKENCLVLDFAQNAKRLGPINDPVIPNKRGQKTGDAPVKVCPICDSYVHASLRFCDGFHNSGVKCTHEFIFETKLKTSASTDELITGDLPIVESFKIEHINFSPHTKVGRPPMMKVSYYCGYRMFEDYVCVEHDGFAGRKARQWLRERLPHSKLPSTTEEAIEMAQIYKVPTHVRIWINKKYPEIMSFCWDSSNFGTIKEPEKLLPTVQTPATKVKEEKEEPDYSDVPF